MKSIGYLLKMRTIDKISTLKQIAVMLEAGIPIDRVLLELKLPIYDDIHNSINSGLSLSDAMSKHSDVFSNLTISMIKLGEITGRLPNAIFKLVNILELTNKNKKTVKNAIRLPVITIVTLVVSFVALMIFMVPTFTDIFNKYEIELPFFTKLLIYIENIFRLHGESLFILLTATFLIIYYQYKHSDLIRLQLDKLMVSKYFYIVNKIVFKSNMYRYHLVLSEMLKAGVTIDDALDRSLDIVDNEYIKMKLESVKDSISKGETLSSAMEKTNLYTSINIQFIHVGESSGKLDSMLKEVSTLYYDELMEIIENMSAYIEPILTFIVAILILFFALGILMPMWNLTSITRVGL